MNGLRISKDEFLTHLLCAVDARFHENCLSLFVSHRNVTAPINKETSSEKDIPFERLTKEMPKNQKQTWNSLLLHSHYVLYGGQLGRNVLLKKLEAHFGKELLIPSSSGIANIVLFKKHCALSLAKADKEDSLIADSIKILVHAI